MDKNLGAYYTGEDIAVYISKHALIAYLFTRVEQTCGTALNASTSLWLLLQANPDRYISTTLRQQEHLPTEIERDYRARHVRYASLKKKLTCGDIACIDDVISYHLDIHQFAQDVLLCCQDRTLLRAFYETLTHMSILDPTCGTGAFLLAAFNILAPLYEACLARMEQLGGFHDILQQVNIYPNRHYYIVTSIITHNLYGVDVMPKAVEQCKASLRLKLLTPGMHDQDKEALFAIDQHIRVGNALIGLLTAPEEEKHVDTTHDQPLPTQTRQQPFDWFREFSAIMQRGGFDVILGNPPYVEYSKVQHDYHAQGDHMRSCGNLYAAVIERSLALCRPTQSYLGLIVPLSICAGQRFEPLRRTLQAQTQQLWLANFEIFPSRLFESAFQRLSIVLAKLSSPLTTEHIHMTYVTKLQRWYRVERPYLLDLISYTNVQYSLRSHVFPKLASPVQESILRKVGVQAQGKCITTLLHPHKTAYFVYYQEATNYWMKAICHVPFYKKNGVVMQPTHGRFLYFRDEHIARSIMAVMNSSLFYVWFSTYSDGFHLSHTLVKDFPLAKALYEEQKLSQLAVHLQQDIQFHAQVSTRNTKANTHSHQAGHCIELEEYRMNFSKPLLDEIDSVLACYYGLSDEELDFLIHYESKYRMGLKS